MDIGLERRAAGGARRWDRYGEVLQWFAGAPVWIGVLLFLGAAATRHGASPSRLRTHA